MQVCGGEGSDAFSRVKPFGLAGWNAMQIKTDTKMEKHTIVICIRCTNERYTNERDYKTKTTLKRHFKHAKI